VEFPQRHEVALDVFDAGFDAALLASQQLSVVRTVVDP
jgi:hypothetical protein